MTTTIQQAIDLLIASVPGAPFLDTVDTVKAGDPSQELRGIAVTFLANCDVIETAAHLGANLLITHEPTFYNHPDQTDWLQDDTVYDAKRKLAEEKGLVIWRFHDYLHSIPPDRTVIGLQNALQWESNGSADESFMCTIPAISLRELGLYVKQQLGLQMIRMVGDPASQCERIALLPGFPPAPWQMGTLRTADVLITGEIHEWETSEYVRDANQLGLPKGLIVIGHAGSEEPGMRAIIPWIQERLPGVPIEFISSEPAFQYL